MSSFILLANGSVATELSWDDIGKGISYTFEYKITWSNGSDYLNYTQVEAGCCRGAINDLPLGANLTVRMFAHGIYAVIVNICI